MNHQTFIQKHLKLCLNFPEYQVNGPSGGNHLFSYFAEFKARTKKDIEFWEQPNRSADGYMLLFQQQLQRHIIGPVAYPSLADTETKVRTNFLPHTRVLQCTNKNIQGDFWTASVHYWNQKMLSSQPELLFHEILHQKEPLIDSLAFYPARALRALGLLLAGGAPTVGGGKTFWAVSRIFLRKQL